MGRTSILSTALLFAACAGPGSESTAAPKFFAAPMGESALPPAPELVALRVGDGAPAPIVPNPLQQATTVRFSFPAGFAGRTVELVLDREETTGAVSQWLHVEVAVKLDGTLRLHGVPSGHYAVRASTRASDGGGIAVGQAVVGSDRLCDVALESAVPSASARR